MSDVRGEYFSDVTTVSSVGDVSCLVTFRSAVKLRKLRARKGRFIPSRNEGGRVRTRHEGMAIYTRINKDRSAHALFFILVSGNFVLFFLIKERERDRERLKLSTTCKLHLKKN